jgi:NTP pyrophosphatase (non-canonical NTP hydrolase)
MKQKEIIKKIIAERKRQDDKWGKQRHQFNSQWMTILTEEVGEVAECVCKTEVSPVNKRVVKRQLKNMEKELIQVAAVAICWLESVEDDK